MNVPHPCLPGSEDGLGGLNYLTTVDRASKHSWARSENWESSSPQNIHKEYST